MKLQSIESCLNNKLPHFRVLSKITFHQEYSLEETSKSDIASDNSSFDVPRDNLKESVQKRERIQSRFSNYSWGSITSRPGTV